MGGGGRERKGVNEVHVDEQGRLVHVGGKEKGLRRREGGRGIEAKEEGLGRREGGRGIEAKEEGLGRDVTGGGRRKSVVQPKHDHS